jgi:hypothetical protein
MHQQKYGEVAVILLKTFTIRESILDHPETSTSYTTIGLVLKEQGNSDEALVALHKAPLAINEYVLGKDHPHTAPHTIALAWFLGIKAIMMKH